MKLYETMADGLHIMHKNNFIVTVHKLIGAVLKVDL